MTIRPSAATSTLTSPSPPRRIETRAYAPLNPDLLVDRVMLRAHARSQVENSPLIRACAEGDPVAARALMFGFWPFVSEFEKAIDERARALPIKLLRERYGKEKVRDFFHQAAAAIKDMRDEEGSHAQLWKADARRLGIHNLGWHLTSGVRTLIDETYESSPTHLFDRLAGTEYIAEELSRKLVASPRFTAQFSNGRWTWGDAHLMTHDDPSHLEIDEDLAQACHQSDDRDEIRRDMEASIRRCEEQFFEASVEVLNLLGTSLLQAA